jgi:hypothetical protein
MMWWSLCVVESTGNVLKFTRSRARAQSLATALVLGSIDAILTVQFDDEHCLAKHGHDEFRSVPQSRMLI